MAMCGTNLDTLPPEFVVDLVKEGHVVLDALRRRHARNPHLHSEQHQIACFSSSIFTGARRNLATCSTHRDD